jgi:hypothetical protein
MAGPNNNLGSPYAHDCSGKLCRANQLFADFLEDSLFSLSYDDLVLRTVERGVTSVTKLKGLGPRRANGGSEIPNVCMK